MSACQVDSQVAARGYEVCTGEKVGDLKWNGILRAFMYDWAAVSDVFIITCVITFSVVVFWLPETIIYNMGVNDQTSLVEIGRC